MHLGRITHACMHACMIFISPNSLRPIASGLRQMASRIWADVLLGMHLGWSGLPLNSSKAPGSSSLSSTAQTNIRSMSRKVVALGEPVPVRSHLNQAVPEVSGLMQLGSFLISDCLPMTLVMSAFMPDTTQQRPHVPGQHFMNVIRSVI